MLNGFLGWRTYEGTQAFERRVKKEERMVEKRGVQKVKISREKRILGEMSEAVICSKAVFFPNCKKFQRNFLTHMYHWFRNPGLWKN